jgi:hypothetical protein
MPPTTPDVRSSDESKSNISPNAPEYNDESEDQKRARERRNKLKEGHRRRARQRKEACDTYKAELAEYKKRKSEREAEERHAARAHRAPYDKIREALEELEAISHPNGEQVQLQEVLRTMALKAHDGRTRSKLPTRTASHEQEAQSRRRSVFEKLGPNKSQNQEKRRDHAQSNQVEHSREERSRASYHSSLWFLPRLSDRWQEGGLSQNTEKSERMIGFPIF